MTSEVPPAMHLAGTDRLVLSRWLPWALPAVLVVLAVVYETSEHRFGLGNSFAAFSLEVFFFGILGPSAVFALLMQMQRVLRARVGAQAETVLLNTHLEKEVAERTAHLEQARDELHAQAQRLEALNGELRRLDELKSDFVSLVSHELRAPLTTLSGGIELISEDAATLPATSRRTLEIIGAESARLRTLVESILDVSRLEAGHLQLTLGPVSVEALIRGCVASASSHEPGRIVTHSRGVVPPVWADELFLEEVFRNVLSNALKYSPPGEPVAVVVGSAGTEVTVEVTNRGPELSREDQLRLFEPFFRAKGSDQQAAGHGLGLYFARKLLEAQGGRISLVSPAFPGPEAPGVTFTMTLPMAPAEVA